MRRTIMAGVLAAHLIALSGAPAQSVLCAHLDGTTQLETGEHGCCAPVLGAQPAAQDARVGSDPDTCAGCSDTLISADTAARSASTSKADRPATATPTILAAPVAPPAHSTLLLAMARRATRDPVLPASTPLLI